jgi:hypothetical protein
MPILLSNRMWSYEGNAPHALTKAFTEGGSPCCMHCGACIGDHTPVGHDVSLSYYEYTATVKVVVKGQDGRVVDDGFERGMTLTLIDEELAY